jgi:hypothetical protein
MTNIKYIAVIVVTLLVTACSSDFLDQPPRGVLTGGTFPETAEDLRLATNGAYGALRIWQIATGGFPLLDIMSDDMTKGSAPDDGTAIAVYERFEHTAQEGSTDRWYKSLYQAIRRCNLVINRAEGIEMDQLEKDLLVAEARFLRAYFYGQLIRGYGDVPLVMVTDPPLDLTRTPVQTILDLVIVPDLEYGIAILPERSQQSSDIYGRATKGAARALLARIHVHYRDYAAAQPLLLDVIESQEYMLEPDYADVFTVANEHGVESIFEVGATPFTSIALGGNQFGNTQGVRGTPNRGWGFGRPAYPWILDMEGNEDPRLEPSILRVGEVIDGITVTGDSNTPDETVVDGQIVEIEVYNQKVWTPGTTTQESWGHNRRLIRYADVLLLAAECLARNGQSERATDLLNEVRMRARGGDDTVLPDVTGLQGDALVDAILEERHYELALESVRFWDLVRTDRAAEVLGPLGFLPNKNELFPIPQVEIDISEGRLTQNPGY